MNVESSNINLTIDDIHQIVRRHFAYHDVPISDLTAVTYNYRRLSEVPVGFLGDHYLLEVNLPAMDPLSFFVKMLPETSQAQTDYIEGFGAFTKEVQLYGRLLPRLQECDVKAWGPHCLFLKDDKLIILEDLSKTHFQGARFTDGTLDYHHMVVALKCLARFHATTFLVEREMGKTLQTVFADELEENSYPKKEGVRAMGFRNACSSLADLIKRIPKYKNSEQLDEILKQFPAVMHKIYDFIEPSTEFRNVVLHADLWANNVMFKYEEVSQNVDYPEPVPVDARLVDYQLARYAPPALDVLTVITIPSDSGFREKHLRQLTQVYYNTLRDELMVNNMDLSQEITAAQFFESCEHFKLAGLIESALFGHLTLMPPEISKELVSTSENFENFIKNSRNDICIKAFKIDDNYRRRMSDLLIEIVDVYVIPLCN